MFKMYGCSWWLTGLGLSVFKEMTASIAFPEKEVSNDSGSPQSQGGSAEREKEGQVNWCRQPEPFFSPPACWDGEEEKEALVGRQNDLPWHLIAPVPAQSWAS